jgi:RHS repeat-associated protein
MNKYGCQYNGIELKADLGNLPDLRTEYEKSLNVGKKDKLYYFHSNHLGSGSMITDNHGDTYQTFAYAPHGESLVQINHYYDWFDNPYRYSAYHFDQESGLLYASARYYDHNVVVPYSTEPLWYKYPSFSPYVMNYNNPINFYDPDGKRGRPARQNNYGTRNYNNNYAMFHNGVQPLSTRTTSKYQRTAMTPIYNDGHSYTQNVITAGNNNVQMSNNNTEGKRLTFVSEFVDNMITNFEFVKMVFYKPDGHVENKTEINLLDFKDQIKQNQWEADYQKLTQELGPMPLLNPMDSESVKKFNDYQQTIQDKIGTSPKQKIMQEYMQNPEKFKKVDSKTEIIPEFRQGQ